MAYLIIGLFIFFVLCWALYMSRTHAAKNRSASFDRTRMRAGGMRRFTRLGRVVVQSDEQRTELIMNNRVRYDASIDRLDPRHPEYKSKGS